MLAGICRAIGTTTRTRLLAGCMQRQQQQYVQSVAALSNSSQVLAKKKKKFKNQQQRPELVDVEEDEDDDFVEEDIDEKTALAAKGILHKGVGEAEDVVDDGLPKDYKRKTVKLASRRLDTLLNRTSGKSSSEVEKMILTGRVQVNEQIVKKKAYNVMKRDEIDVWLEQLEENPMLAYIHRAKVVDYVLKQHGYDVDVMLWSKMIVENFRHDKENETADTTS